MKKVNGGFIGILGLLIVVAIMAFIMIRTDLFNGSKNEGSMIETGLDAVDKANEAKNMIEENNKKAIEE